MTLDDSCAFKHFDGTVHGGKALIIKNTIKFDHYYIQAISIVVEDWHGNLTISAVYSPLKHKITKEQCTEFFQTLGTRFITDGDYNVKHPWWGSRLSTLTQKNRQLYLSMQQNNAYLLPTGEPT